MSATCCSTPDVRKSGDIHIRLTWSANIEEQWRFNAKQQRWLARWEPNGPWCPVLTIDVPPQIKRAIALLSRETA